MKYHSSQNGFSLVETLVAITILLLVIAGPMAISSSAAKSTSFSSEQVAAFFLAQEGSELVQKFRDDLMVRHFIDPADTLYSSYVSDPWGDFIGSIELADCFNAAGCGLEMNTNEEGSIRYSASSPSFPADCSVITNCKLRYDDSAASVRARYTYDPTAPLETPFTRVVTITPDGANSVRITSKVTWRTGAQRKQQEVKVETYLFNVYGN